MSTPNESPMHKQKAIWLTLALACLAVLVPSIFGWRSRARMSQMKECQEWLTKFDGAKEQWALENNKPAGAEFTERDVEEINQQGYCGTRSIPKQCPSGRGKYKLNPIGTDPICTSGLPGHLLSEVGMPITQLQE